MQDKLQRQLGGNFDGAAIHFTVALHRMAIAGKELSVGLNTGRNSGGDAGIFQVDVAAPGARRSTNQAELRGGATAMMPMKA
jgi:hypothetical protein